MSFLVAANPNSYVWAIGGCLSGEGAVRPAASRFALWTSVKIIAALVAVFVLARLVIPNLVNSHNTPLLLLAILCGVAALAIAIWTAVSVWRAYRRLRRRSGHLVEARK